MKTAYVDLHDFELVLKGEITQEEYFTKHAAGEIDITEEELEEAIASDEED